MGRVAVFGREKDLVFDARVNLMKFIVNSIGTNLYRSCYFRKSDGTYVDVCQDGKFSCAYFPSVALHRVGLIQNIRVTVRSFEDELKLCGWELYEGDIKKAPVGSVVFWESKKASDGEIHSHAGFWWGGNQCVSNHPVKRVPEMHDYLFRYFGKDCLDCRGRKIEKIYTHPVLLDR
ncbi:MAG: hypothetical protein K9M15_02500 [Candidatus Marinimicrobia bacterium]|nr:hypothetical protein [Candidatus Neomarinimicrobiota bacterium]